MIVRSSEYFAATARDFASPHASFRPVSLNEDVMRLIRLGCAAFGAAILAWSGAQAQTLDKVSFGTNWLAEPEHGGFYQALADGTYRRHGLDVTIVPGGPQVNNRILLTVGKLDFFMS